MALGSDSSEPIERWTAKRRAALVVSILKGETTAAEAARRHGLKVGEIDDRREKFQQGVGNALCAQPKDEEALKDEQIKKLKQKVGELVLDLDILRERTKGRPVLDVGASAVRPRASWMPQRAAHPTGGGTVVPERPVAPRHDVFFSHSTSGNADHDELVGALFGALTRRGLVVFWDRTCLHGGEPLLSTLEEAIHASRAAVVFVSRLAAASGWVEFELVEIVRESRRRPMPVVAVRLEPGCPLPPGIAPGDILVPENLTNVSRLADQLMHAVDLRRSPRHRVRTRSPRF